MKRITVQFDEIYWNELSDKQKSEISLYLAETLVNWFNKK